MRKFRYPQLRQGLVGAWCPSLGVTGNLLLDRSGRGSHGTLTNGPAWQASGSGLALSFDGTNDHVSTSFLAASASQIGNIAWSIWIHPRQLNVYQAIFSSFVNDSQVMELFIDNNSSRVGAGNFVSPSWSVTGSVSVNAWTHVAFNRNGTTNTLFINGVSVSSATSTNNGNNVAMFIGSRSGAFNFYNGLIDDFNYYYRNLTPNEILTLYTAGRGAIHQTYEVPVVRGAAVGPSGFKAAWAQRRQQIIGSGVI